MTGVCIYDFSNFAEYYTDLLSVLLGFCRHTFVIHLLHARDTLVTRS